MKTINNISRKYEVNSILYSAKTGHRYGEITEIVPCDSFDLCENKSCDAYLIVLKSGKKSLSELTRDFGGLVQTRLENYGEGTLWCPHNLPPHYVKPKGENT